MNPARFARLPSLLLALVALLTLALPAPARSAEELPLVFSEFPPFNYQEEGDVKGISAEIIATVVRRMGFTPKITRRPFKRALDMTLKGHAAGYFTFTKNPQRLKNYFFSAPITTISDVFFKRKERKIDWNELADLSTLRVGATDGYNYASAFKNAMKNGTLKVDSITSRTPEIQHLKKLAKGRIDLAICEVSLCSYLIARNPDQFKDLDYIPKEIGPVRNFHLGFSKAWPRAEQLRDRFNAELTQLAREGERTRIHQKYGAINRLD